MRFLHTSDWQLGMTRHYFDPGTQEVFSQSRFDAIVRMAELAENHDCDFVVVAGDVFETNQVDRRTVVRALQAMESFSVPVYLLPGNHDCYDPGSVYRSNHFLENRADHVHVLDDGDPRSPVDGVEVIGAPWTSKRPLHDLVGAACEDLEADGRRRVIVGHGVVDEVLGEVTGDPGLIRLAGLEPGLEQGSVSYVALGDRHSLLEVGESGGVWYSGAPEPTAYREVDAGNALIVDVAGDRPQTEAVEVGQWHFHEIEQDVSSDDDLDELEERLGDIPDHPRAIVKVKLVGSLTLRQSARLDEIIDHHRDLMGVLEQPERHRDLVVRPEDEDFADLPLHGYAAVARDRLQERAQNGGDGAEAAADALGLLLRLTKQEA